MPITRQAAASCLPTIVETSIAKRTAVRSGSKLSAKAARLPKAPETGPRHRRVAAEMFIAKRTAAGTGTTSSAAVARQPKAPNTGPRHRRVTADKKKKADKPNKTNKMDYSGQPIKVSVNTPVG